MSMKEISEKSHDYAWTNTSTNNYIDLSDIIFEAGGDNEYADYIKENYCAKTLEK